MRQSCYWLLAIIAATQTETAVADLIYGDGGVHVVDSVVSDVVGVWDGFGPTTVTFRDGATITGTDRFDDTLYVLDRSIVFIEGGDFADDVSAYNQAQITISGGSLGDDLFATNRARVTVTGGQIADDVEAFGASMITLAGGSFGEDVEAVGGSIVVTGGLFAQNGLANLDTGFGVANGGSITLVGSGFLLNGQALGSSEITDVSGLLSGTLADGTSFSNIPFTRDLRGNGAIGFITITAVPEPSALSLIALAGLLTINRYQRGKPSAD